MPSIFFLFSFKWISFERQQLCLFSERAWQHKWRKREDILETRHLCVWHVGSGRCHAYHASKCFLWEDSRGNSIYKRLEHRLPGAEWSVHAYHVTAEDHIHTSPKDIFSWIGPTLRPNLKTVPVKEHVGCWAVVFGTIQSIPSLTWLHIHIIV